ncbi:hypothetical protein HCUR_00614 [Holospora curviuscula]|uniref:Uncharacterized protein n=1 Tax=Holospora curviuscula TaxID=1082868 RepID=A0A2S5R954_9PROT|nr:hypothetical protein HCUR_00614 [Holospora curviuscula]
MKAALRSIFEKIKENLLVKKSRKYYERINIIAEYINHKPIALMVFVVKNDLKSWFQRF